MLGFGVSALGARVGKLAGPLAPEKLKEHRELSGPHSLCPAQEGRGKHGFLDGNLCPTGGARENSPCVLSMDGRKVGQGKGYSCFL